MYIAQRLLSLQVVPAILYYILHFNPTPMERINESKLASLQATASPLSLQCPKLGCGASPTFLVPIESTSGMVCTLQCGRCHAHWVACISCDKGRHPVLKNAAAARYHHKTFHTAICCHGKSAEGQTTTEAATSTASNEDLDTFFFDNESEEPFESEDAPPTENHGRPLPESAFETNLTSSTLAFGFHMSDQQERYFRHDLCLGKTEVVGGNRFLVMQSHMQTQDVPVCSNQWDSDNTELTLHLANLCLDISKDNQARLARSLALCCNIRDKAIRAEMEGTTPAGFQSVIPRDYAQLRNLISEGNTAFLQNLPHPAHETMFDIAFLRIINCLQDVLGHGFLYGIIVADDPRFQEVCSHFLNSPEAKRLLERARAVIPFISGEHVFILFIWEDDYESNYNKTERDSGAFKSALTIAGIPLNDPTAKPHWYTYPLIIGPKNSEHYGKVDAIHNEELDRLSGKGDPVFLYSKRQSECEGKIVFVRVYAEVLLSLQDQPQRRKSNKLARGNSLLHGQFGYVFNFEENLEQMPSCSNCKTRLAADEEDILCQNCHSWFIDPATYRLSYELLRLTADTVHEAVATGSMASDVGRDRLRQVCIEKSLIDDIIERADNIRVYNSLSSQDRLGDYQHLVRLKELRPEMFQKAPLPASWFRSQWELWKNIDVPMHILFLGMIKTVMAYTNVWMKGKKYWPQFTDHMKGRMQTLEAMSLSWLKIKEYGKTEKFGGKVSENFVADSRVLPWTYSVLCNLREDNDWEEPVTPPHY